MSTLNPLANDTPAQVVGHVAEAGLAVYALDHAAKGTPIGAEGGLGSQAARTGGNFVIAALLFHYVIIPYLVVTGVVFAIPSVVAAVLRLPAPLVLVMFVVSLVLWIRYALYKWLYRKFIRPVDAGLSGRTHAAGPTGSTPTTHTSTSPVLEAASYTRLWSPTTTDDEEMVAEVVRRWDAGYRHEAACDQNEYNQMSGEGKKHLHIIWNEAMRTGEPPITVVSRLYPNTRFLNLSLLGAISAAASAIRQAQITQGVRTVPGGQYHAA